MSTTKLNVTGISNNHSVLSSVITTVSQLENGVRSTGSCVDSRIKSRRSISSRLSRAASMINDIEKSLTKSEKVIADGVEEFASVDNSLSMNAKSISEAFAFGNTAFADFLYKQNEMFSNNQAFDGKSGTKEKPLFNNSQAFSGSAGSTGVKDHDEDNSQG